MKKIAFLIAIVIILGSCSSSKEASITKHETKNQKKLAEQEAIKKAVESRRYIIKLNKLYSTNGGTIDLVPTSNFVIINGGIASVRLFYAGITQFSRPVSAINFNGHTITYEMKSDQAKGTYTINTRVNKGADDFDLYITIGISGSASLSVINPHIQSVSYRGEVMPIPTEVEPSTANEKRL